MTGVLLTDKPEGTTSAGLIRALKGRLRGAKVGHLGTLDPFASGLLPLCIGEATKIARYLLLERKAYEGTIRLGVATDTLDRTGAETATAPVPQLSPSVLQDVAARFTGVIQQVPPMYSALKRDGVPLYRLARRGIEVEREARPVEISYLELTASGPDRLEFRVGCSKGTYVRVLACDLGHALGTVAHLERLRRTAVGAFRIEDALTLDDLLARPSAEALPLVSVRAALPELRAFTLDPQTLARLRHGQQQSLRGLPGPAGREQAALLVDGGGTVAAIVEPAPDASGWRLGRLLADADGSGEPPS